MEGWGGEWGKEGVGWGLGYRSIAASRGHCSPIYRFKPLSYSPHDRYRSVQFCLNLLKAAGQDDRGNKAHYVKVRKQIKISGYEMECIEWTWDVFL